MVVDILTDVWVLITIYKPVSIEINSFTEFDLIVLFNHKDIKLSLEQKANW